MNTGFSENPEHHFGASKRDNSYITVQLLLSRDGSVRCDFSGGQITGDARLLPLRAFDQHHYLTGGLVAVLSDPRQDERIRHDSLALL